MTHNQGVCLFQVRGRSIYDFGSALLAGNGLFHSWMLCLPMLVIVQSSSYNFLRLFLSTMFILYFTKWSPYYKIYRVVHCLVSLLRYRRVEKYCDKCERHLVQQLNSYKDISLKSGETSAGRSSISQSTFGDERGKVTPVQNKLSGSNAAVKSREKSETVPTPFKTPQQIGWRLRSYRRFPWRVFSRNWGRLANTQFYFKWINTFLIWLYAKGFGCKLEEAEFQWTDYKTLGHFFTRKLKPGIRPICPNAQIVSPADGSMTHFGQFKGGFLEQVKGSHYSLAYFLGLQSPAQPGTSGTDPSASGKVATMHASVSEGAVASSLLHKKDGSTVLMQMIIYLSPGDYHRFHSPTDWSVIYRR